MPTGCSTRIARPTCSPCSQDETRNDTLLLRLALAQQALARPEAAASIEITACPLRREPRAWRHRACARERALRARAAQRRPKRARRYALDNWKVQREPADLRILAEAAAAANDAAALGTVRRWLAETGLEYPAVAALAGGHGMRAK